MRPDTAGPSCEAAGEAPHAAGEPCGAEVGAGRAAAPARPYGRGVMLYRGVVGALAIACAAYAAFTALCGLNYYRLPFSSHLGYDVEQSSVEELEGQMCIRDRFCAQHLEAFNEAHGGRA